MILYRDYFISAPWRVMIFDDRIGLINPGALPNSYRRAHPKRRFEYRNPLLASFPTKELPYRGIGTGIRRALAAVPELWLDLTMTRTVHG